MIPEDDLLPISALQHLVFCERQCALIYIEDIWAENRLTMEGRVLHDQADESETEVRGDLRIARGLRLRSLRLGLVGRADVVEFHRLSGSAEPDALDPAQKPSAVRLKGVADLWRPEPVEYKRGKPKPDRCDEVQLCAQAICLEEMLNVSISSGQIYYGTPHRRYDVSLDDALREETEAAAVRLHELFRERKTPPARYEKKCRGCSLFDLCLPKATGARQSTRGYLSGAFEDVRKETI